MRKVLQPIYPRYINREHPLARALLIIDAAETAARMETYRAHSKETVDAWLYADRVRFHLHNQLVACPEAWGR